MVHHLAVLITRSITISAFEVCDSLDMDFIKATAPLYAIKPQAAVSLKAVGFDMANGKLPLELQDQGSVR